MLFENLGQNKRFLIVAELTDEDGKHKHEVPVYRKLKSEVLVFGSGNTSVNSICEDDGGFNILQKDTEIISLNWN